MRRQCHDAVGDRANLIGEFANKPDEVHALWSGFYTGLVHMTIPDYSKRDEKHYFRFGFVAGRLLKVVFIIYAADAFGLTGFIA